MSNILGAMRVNISLKEYEESDALRNFILPSSESTLLTHDKRFYEKLATGTIAIVLKKEQFANHIDFNTTIGVGGYSLFGEILRILISQEKDIDNYMRLVGFDGKHLPDNNYLIRLIYLLDPESPFIQNMPRIGDTAVSRNLKIEMSQKLLDKALSGKQLKIDTGITFSEINDHVKEVLKLSLVYRMAKFQVTEFNSDVKRALENAHSNPHARILADRYNLAGKIASIAQTVRTALPIEQRQPTQTSPSSSQAQQQQ